MRSTLLLLFLLVPCRTLAQDVPSPPDIPPGEDRIEHVVSGGRAPYEGMLLDIDTSIRWTNRLNWWPEHFRLHLLQDEEMRAAVSRSHETELRIVRESLEREIEGLRTEYRESVVRYEEQLAATRNTPFYESWGFAFGMGALAMGVVVALVSGLVLGL